MLFEHHISSWHNNEMRYYKSDEELFIYEQHYRLFKWPPFLVTLCLLMLPQHFDRHALRETLN